MIKAVDRIGVEQDKVLGYGSFPSSNKFYAVHFRYCSVPIPTNKFSFMPPCTPPCEIALRKKNYAGANEEILLKQGIIYSERVGKNKKLGEKK